MDPRNLVCCARRVMDGGKAAAKEAVKSLAPARTAGRECFNYFSNGFSGFSR